MPSGKRRIYLEEPETPRKEEQERFPLGKLIPDIRFMVVEKLELEDFAMFHECSQLSMDVCSQIKEPMYEICTLRSAENDCWMPNMIETFPLDNVPENIRLKPTALEFTERDLRSVIKYKVTSVEKVFFYLHTAEDPDFVKSVLQLVKPKCIELSRFSIRDVLELEELKQLEFMMFSAWTGFNEIDFLSIKNATFHCACEDEDQFIAPKTVIKFLQQWKEGSREINAIAFPCEN